VESGEGDLKGVRILDFPVKMSGAEMQRPALREQAQHQSLY